MAIDRIDWHNGADNFPKELAHESGGTHIGMFITWVLYNNLEGDLHKTNSVESVNSIKARKMTGTKFLIKECDEKFLEDDLGQEGLEFAKHYYEQNTYYEDYEKTLVTTEPTLYHVQDTWGNYDKISTYIDSAFKKWREIKNRKWWQFWLQIPIKSASSLTRKPPRVLITRCAQRLTRKYSGFGATEAGVR